MSVHRSKVRQVYLASDSKARKKILRIFGFKFRVIPSKVKEGRNARGNFSELVKNNALKKAQDVAGRLRGGIIIAADTIVVAAGRVYGKPKDLADARRMLKRLSRSRQMLYTGVAVIDKDRGRTLLDCEKTQIFMDKLSDREIKLYFSKVSPLDKAGSFDIQGRGAFFIRKIDGCFYNVVGLPIRRVYLMLKKLGVRILVVCMSIGATSFFLSGCMTEYNLATNQEEVYFYSTEREVRLGESIVKKIKEEYEFVEDPLILKRVEDIGSSIVSVCDRKDINYHFFVLDDEEINAFSLPGGFVYVNKGLIDKTKNDDELAGVIGHEVSHIVARHSIKKLQALMGYSILQALIIASPAPDKGKVANAADLAFTEIMLGYSRDDELFADELATRYLRLAGYNPQGMIDFLEKLQEVHRRRPLRPYSYFKTHPYVPDRIRVVKQELGQKINFTDYINIEETKGQ